MSISRGWKIYFVLLALAFSAYLIFLIYFALTAKGVDSGLGVAAGIVYLIYFAIFVAVNVAVYALGARFPVARRLLAICLIVGAIGTSAYLIFGVYKQNQFETRYQPLTYEQAVGLINDCQVTSVTADTNGWPQLNLSDGTQRVVAGSTWLEDLQALSESAVCTGS